MSLRLPIGIDDFAKVIEGEFVYVDKSLFIEEVLDQSSMVQLITRPRRFGKTLNMSMLAELVAAILSYYDTGGKTPERVYHLFVLGLLAHLTGCYTIRSNREAGLGRYDVMMLPKNPQDRGIIIEFKAASALDELDDCLDAALTQIKERNYAHELKETAVSHISEIAVACFGKHIAVRARHLAG